MGEQDQTPAKSDVDEAPTMKEAVEETTELTAPVATAENDILQVAAEAEGAIGLPDGGEGSGEPTEAVSEMPQVQTEGQTFGNGESVLDVPAAQPAEFQ